MSSVTLAEGVYWVGAVDWNLRDFHGYRTYSGTTYNAYLIVDERIALIDTVKAPFYEEMLGRIREIVNPAEIDFIVANHVEMDHSGSLHLITQEAGKAQVLTSEKFGEAGLLRTFHRDFRLLPVREGSELKLGKHKLRFIPIPMLHWPDSMCTYLEKEAILFPNDAFGQHLATSGRFDDEVDLAVVMAEAAKYYANILMPFGSLVSGALEKLGKLNIRMIAPSHGIIWRSNPEKIVQSYASWAKGETRNKVVVIYDTMWESTERMAVALAEGVIKEGVETKLCRLSQSELSDIIAEVLEAKAIIVGSSTLNNGMLPRVAAFLHYLKGLKPQGKIGASFGSYGWGGGAKREIEQALKQAGVDVLDSELEVKFVPQREEIERCFQFGRKVAHQIKK
jgi:flavorubredoxin